MTTNPSEPCPNAPGWRAPDTQPAPPFPDSFLRVPHTARMLGVSPRTLQHWRTNGIGPTWTRLGEKAIRYRMSDIDAWLRVQHREVLVDSKSQ